MTNSVVKTKLKPFIGVESDYDFAETRAPERNLLSAVLIRAWADLHQTSQESDWRRTSSRRIKPQELPSDEDARQWFVSESLHPFSFRWVCRYLSINHEVVREFVARNSYSLETNTASPVPLAEHKVLLAA